MLATAALLIALVLVTSFALAIIRSDRPLIKHTVSHWQQTVTGLKGSTKDFYATVEAVIRGHTFPEVEVRTVALNEGGMFSEKREYLRVERGEMSFDLCVAPFGEGLFVSSWLCQKPSFLLQVLAHFPIINWLSAGWAKLFHSPTYYRVDSQAMFLDGIHGCVLGVLDEMTKTQGVEPIPAEARKPIMRELYDRGGRKSKRSD